MFGFQINPKGELVLCEHALVRNLYTLGVEKPSAR
jgi:hypothetical protein